MPESPPTNPQGRHPFVLLHGFAGAPSSWSAVLGHLAAHRAAALALPGHARDVPVAGSFEGNVDQVALRVGEVGSSVHLVGYSLGARIALGLLASHPSLVASATLVSVNPGIDSEKERRARLASDCTWAELLRTDGIEAFVQAWERLPLFASQRRLAGQVTREQRTLRLAHNAEGLARALEGMGLGQMPNLGPTLANTSVRVQLVVGELDSKFVALARQATSRNPRIRLHVLPQCGHNPLLEAPSELARLLARWSNC